MRFKNNNKFNDNCQEFFPYLNFSTYTMFLSDVNMSNQELLRNWIIMWVSHVVRKVLIYPLCVPGGWFSSWYMDHLHFFLMQACIGIWESSVICPWCQQVRTMGNLLWPPSQHVPFQPLPPSSQNSWPLGLSSYAQELCGWFLCLWVLVWGWKEPWRAGQVSVSWWHRWQP